MVSDIVIDPEFQRLLMPLTPEEYAQLERNILENGCLDPLKVWQRKPERDYKCYYDPAIMGGDYDYGDGPCRTEDVLIAEDGVWRCEACDHNAAPLEDVLLDGHNRYEICTKLGIEFQTECIDIEDRRDARNWIINNQLGRRNLTLEQVSYLRGLRFLSEKKSHGGDRKSTYHNDKLNDTATKLAEEYKVSRPTITRDAEYAFAVDTIGLIAGEETKRDILAGNTKLTKQDVIAIQEMSPAKQIKTIEMIQNGEARSMRDAERLTRRAEVAEAVAIPTGKYRVIYADPPWKYGDNLTEDYGGTQYHYPSMTISELCEKIPVTDMAEDNAVLFLWVTSPLLQECFSVIKAWGFKYKASFVWDKIKHNMGHYNSVRHEFLLVCTRGSCTPDVGKLFDSVQSIERTEHSAKPEEFRQIIDTIYPHGARLELFARKQAEGWEAYGNQLT